MCIAIYKPAENTIHKDNLAQCFKSNPDGAGFMYRDGKGLHVQKGFFTFNEFWEAYQPHEHKQAVIHFRIKTHGAINVDNCHPFSINKSFGFVHNGVISGFGNGEISDTREFNEEILKPIVEKWGNLSLFQPAIKSLVESKIGYSKLIFLDKSGNYDIFNEDKGSWDNGVWYSNSTYKIPEPVKTFSVDKSKWNSYLPKPKKDRALKEGELVYLKRGFFDTETKTWYRAGEVLEVLEVNSDLTASLMVDNLNDDPEFLYNVPFHAFDFWDDGDDDVIYEHQSSYYPNLAWD